MGFISEIHYRNAIAARTGLTDCIEVVVAPDDLQRIGEFTIATYQADGSLRTIAALSDLQGAFDPETGRTVFRVGTPNVTAAGTDVKALALIDGTTVASFHQISAPWRKRAPGHAHPIDGLDQEIDQPVGQRRAPVSGMCLTKGTMIDTDAGPRPVETLTPGDLVQTLDNGLQPVRLVHQTRMHGVPYKFNRALWPVCIQAGALGFGLPTRDLWVAQDHRMLYRHIRISLMFGEDAVFVRAKSLAASFEEIYVDSGCEETTYVTLAFDQHEVIFAEGAPTETFYPSAETLRTLSPDLQAEYLRVFPDLDESTARLDLYPTLRSWELKAMVG